MPSTSTLNRNTAFHQLAALGDKQRTVLDAIRAHGPIADRALSERLGWPVNRSVPRRNELVEMGYVVEAGTGFDPDTRRAVTLWACSGAVAASQAVEGYELTTAPAAVEVVKYRYHLAAIGLCESLVELKAVAAAIKHDVPPGHPERTGLLVAWRAKEKEFK